MIIVLAPLTSVTEGSSFDFLEDYENRCYGKSI